MDTELDNMCACVNEVNKVKNQLNEAIRSVEKKRVRDAQAQTQTYGGQVVYNKISLFFIVKKAPQTQATENRRKLLPEVNVKRISCFSEVRIPVAPPIHR
jgi:uncharacterized protein YoxC